jgi:hypothetical protein
LLGVLHDRQIVVSTTNSWWCALSGSVMSFEQVIASLRMSEGLRLFIRRQRHRIVIAEHPLLTTFLG